MKKVLCAVLVLVMCIALAAPAFAAEVEFVPSISFKDGPTVVSGKLGDEEVGPCLVVTSILAATNKTTDIPQETRDLLLSVYDQLDKGTMTLPIEQDYVVRELVDVSWAMTTCVGADHGHDAELAKDGTSVTIVFDLGITAADEIVVLQYSDNAWTEVESTNNGDGTMTCVFEHFCPVAFVNVEESTDSTDATDSTGTTVAPGTTTPESGDNMNLALWIGLMVASAAVLVVGIANRRRIFG